MKAENALQVSFSSFSQSGSTTRSGHLAPRPFRIRARRILFRSPLAVFLPPSCSVGDDGRLEIQRAGQHVIVARPTESPFGIESRRARKQLVAHKA